MARVPQPDRSSRPSLRSPAARAERARYVAIITDGNGRWAQRRGLPVIAGHEAGADTVKARLRDAVELGVRELTVYSFSTENWSRDEAEVAGLMEMFGRRIELETPELHAEGVRMRFLGPPHGAGGPGAGAADEVGRGADRRQPADHAVRGLQLRRPGGDRRRGANLYGDAPRTSSAPISMRPTCTTPIS